VSVEALCAVLVGDSARAARDHVTRLRSDGIAVETLAETVIPRAAARLGEMWVADTLGFAAVTLGMARLTDVYRGLGPDLQRGRAAPRPGRRALFALTPGETHALGIVMAADRFERAGWAVRVELRSDARDLGRLAGAHGFDLIGLSAGSRRLFTALSDTVDRLRRAARPGTPIVVGGHACTLEPDLAALCGADAAHDTADAALATVEARLGPGARCGAGVS